MPRVPSRSKLEEMNRMDIQKLCKDLGVRANLKTTALIDLLLDASKPAPAKSVPTPRSRTASSATKVSCRRTSGRSTRGFSRGSVIIHDSEPEDDEEGQGDGDGNEQEPAGGTEPDNANETDNGAPAPSEAESTPVPPPPASRTRKAKDTQTRLGMGRPVIAGGSGARVVTKSISIAKNVKRGKNSRNIRAAQETIREEEPEPSPTIPSPPNATSQPNYLTSQNATTSTYKSSKSSQDSLASLEAIDKRVADAIRLLHAQMSSLKSEVERLRNQVADFPKLQIKVLNLTTELETLHKDGAAKTSELKAEIGRLKEHGGEKSQPFSSSSSGPGTPGKLTPGKYRSLQRPTGFNGPSATVASRSVTNGKAPLADPTSIMTPDHPGFAAVVTGKRRRDSDAGDITGVIEEGHEDEFSEGEIERRVIVPNKKRARLDDGEHSQEGRPSGSSQAPSAQSGEQGEQTSNSGPPSFTIFSGPDEPDNMSIYVDPPPPTNHLPEYFTTSPDRPASNGSGNGVQTSTAHAPENRNPFGFNFLPMTSTPLHPIYPMPQNFPYPEAPTSPSPVGNDRAFQFGMHTSRPRSGAHTSRPGSRQEGDGTGTVDPAALTGRQPESSTDAETGLAMGTAQGAVVPTKRTMYGTELDVDSRFGDFGFEGVASGFWAGGRF